MWYYQDKEFNSEDIGDNYGFVYCITDIKTNKKYIGKKFFWSSKTKTIKGKNGKPKRKKFVVESDWMKYYGSNAVLKEEVLNENSEYHREIIHLCKKRGDCSYMEAKEQFERNVLISDEYYNQFIGCRIHSKHLSK